MATATQPAAESSSCDTPALATMLRVLRLTDRACQVTEELRITGRASADIAPGRRSGGVRRMGSMSCKDSSDLGSRN